MLQEANYKKVVYGNSEILINAAANISKNSWIELYCAGTYNQGCGIH